MAGDHGARVQPYRGLPGVDTGRSRRLVSLLRAEWRFELRRRSGRARTLRVRRVRHSRRRSQAGKRRRRRGGNPDSGLRQDYRRWRVDQLVRPPRACQLHHPDGQAGSSRRCRRPESTPRQVRPRRAAVSARHGGSEHGRAPRGDRACAGLGGPGVRAGVLQAAGSKRGGHASGLRLRHLRSDGAVAGQYLDPGESGGARRTARRRDRRRRTRSRASWATIWPAS